jgi:hypothetical protein
MTAFWKVIGVWSIADGAWMAIAPHGWSQFWLRFMKKAVHRRATVLPIALAEIGIGLLLLRKATQPAARSLTA